MSKQYYDICTYKYTAMYNLPVALFLVALDRQPLQPAADHAEQGPNILEPASIVYLFITHFRSEATL